MLPIVGLNLSQKEDKLIKEKQKQTMHLETAGIKQDSMCQ